MGVFSTAKLDQKKVIVGLSGGVDSTVAVLLLQEQGYEVTGLYFDVMPEGVAGKAAGADEKAVAAVNGRADSADGKGIAASGKEVMLREMGAAPGCNAGDDGMKAAACCNGRTACCKADVAGGDGGAGHGKGSVHGKAGMADVSGGGALTGGRQVAEAAARQLGIDFIYRNVADIFEQTVIENFCREYAGGRTPNPCIVCNPGVKFRTLLAAADEAGAYHIATGHYAGTYYDESNETWYIRRAANERKDQSYMLYRLGQEAISRLLLPLNQIEDKEKARELARENSLQNAEAKDSQEICFIDADDRYQDFLARRGVTAEKGNFVDSAGTVLGEHQGILNYTIGQRKGLGIALGRPVFVTGIDSVKNTVVLGDHEDLLHREVISVDNILHGVVVTELSPEERMAFWEKHAEDGNSVVSCATDLEAVARGEIPKASALKASGSESFAPKKTALKAVTAKIRYAAKPADAVIALLPDGRIKTVFTAPQRAVTPGQSIVFYSGDLVIGGGFIE